MNFKIKDIIFTNQTKDGKELKRKNWDLFFMLHLEVEEVGDDKLEWNKHWKWISKFYNEDKWDSIKQKIKVWELYKIEYRQSWIYKNIISVRDKDDNIII